MTRQWAPGDVAMVAAHNRSEPYRAYYDGRDETWRACDGAMFCVDQPTSIRPLVVIDVAEDTWLPNRLRIDADRFHAGSATAKKMREIADQIEAQIEPPKPAEPLGLGAVVEDADGHQWARAVCVGESSPWCRRDGGARWAGWFHVKAVRVLSEGVA